MSKETIAPQGTVESTEKKRYRKLVTQFGIEGVEFNSVQDFLGIMRNDEEFTFETFKERIYFNEVSNIIINEESVVKAWEASKKYSAAECIKRFGNNEQQLMIAFKYIGPDAALKQLNGELISEEKITKKQKRAILKNPDLKSLMNRHNKERLPADAFEMTDVEYEDTYKLFKIPKETYHQVGMSNMDIDTYVVECVCPSKQEHFFLYVPAHEVEQCNTAFGAIAWTFKHHDGRHFTIDEWKELAYGGEEQ